MHRILACGVALLFAAAAHAQGSDELWEVTSQMNMPGLPSGMGGSKQQLCRDKDPKKDATSRRETSECKVTDMKESGNTLRMTLQCPQGTAVIENTYNAARTEYKGTFKINTKDGEMVITQQGRKIGACNAQQARADQAAKADAYRKQGAEAQASAAAMLKQSRETQIKQCNTALDNMGVTGFGIWYQCDSQKSTCDTYAKNESTKEVAAACQANFAEYCKRFQTPQGFYKARGDERGAQACKLSSATLKPQLCQRALKDDYLAFVGFYCPVEAKPIAQKNCVGRSYTSKTKDKYSEFCMNYLANNQLEEQNKPTSQKAKEAVTDSVNQGLNKLRGLFGK